MSFAEKIRKVILAIGDIVCFYLALYLMALLRNLTPDYFSVHLKLFSLIFLAWLIVFYAGHFYELNNLKERKKIISLLFKLQLINILLAIVIFYLYPIITPKTNLVLIIVFSSVLVLIWRLIFYSIFSHRLVYKTILIGESGEIKEIKKQLEESPHLGYKVIQTIEKIDVIKKEELEKIIENNNVKVIVVDNLVNQKELKDLLLKMMFRKIEIYNTPDFYALIFKCVPLNFVDENWFLDYFNLYHQKINLFIKNVCDFVLALILLILSLFFWPLIILAIKIDSSGPVFYSSWRVGQNGKLFKIYKFRSMYQNASNFSRWSKNDDERITKVGKFLRKTHLDELPQLINILKGEMSFVGPRPIEKELFDLCIKEKPIYYLRNLIKPGLAGWAQLNYHYAACLEDELKKFEYDLYYIKNQSFWFDVAIILRTIKVLINW
jgi:exopolysaccharide biosynthesis polyprenyl glycosylphosphotransferase